MPRKCAVCDNVQNNCNIFFHKLPSNKEIKRAWIHFIKSKKGPSWKASKHVFICNQHFDASSYKISLISNPLRMYLKPNVIPSILEVESYNTTSHEKQYNEEQFNSNLHEENDVDEKIQIEKIGTYLCDEKIDIEEFSPQKQPNLSEIDESDISPEEPQLEYTISSNIQLECVDKQQFQAKQENSFENHTNRNKHEEQIDNIQEISTKKKRKQGYNISEKRSPVEKSCYVEDVKLCDFKTSESIMQHWEIAVKTIKELRRQNKMLKRKCQRYDTKITDLKNLMAQLEQEKKFISDMMNS